MKIELRDIGSDHLDFIGFAVDHGFESMKNGGVLVPFVFTLHKGKRELQRFLSDTILSSIQSADAYVKNIHPQAEIAVLIYEGSIGAHNEKKDAIMAKVWLGNKILVFAQPYRRDNVGGISPTGDYLYLECKESIPG